MDCEGLPTGPELTVCQAARAAADAADAARKLAEGDSWSEIVIAILGAIGALALPVLAVVVLILIWPLLRDVFETRKFTLKIGGFELSAQEATDQIREQIKDLQAQIAELKDLPRPPPPVAGSDILVSDDVLAAPAPASPETALAPAPDASLGEVAATPPTLDPTPDLLPGAILWVDDKPSNNAFLIADFQDRGLIIDQALSTAEALRKLSSQTAHYRVVISDLGRLENDRYVPEAGGQLAKEIRSMGLTTPMIIFSSARSAQDRERLIKAGATDVTNNSTRLRTWVLRHFKGRAA